jgi:hypothetical protein
MLNIKVNHEYSNSTKLRRRFAFICTLIDAEMGTYLGFWHYTTRVGTLEGENLSKVQHFVAKGIIAISTIIR